MSTHASPQIRPYAPSPARAAVRYGFRGAWAGLFVGAIGCAVVIVVAFFTGLATGASRTVLGFGLTMTADGGFDLALDVTPFVTVATLGALVGALAGVLYGVRRRRP